MPAEYSAPALVTSDIPLDGKGEVIKGCFCERDVPTYIYRTLIHVTLKQACLKRGRFIRLVNEMIVLQYATLDCNFGWMENETKDGDYGDSKMENL
ncbi:hypothetical protein CEXT_786101 [Caerostris extrusa]|uniref:Uncharacterized protein n=1 Tax=Caerostris extrusa TaxID=172846 RepID=A0AAV4VRH6_CAEEX|nr:hypothetical protein CEXT_786101 [Caerostris extrusa]